MTKELTGSAATVAVVLAAGAGSRFAGAGAGGAAHKLLARIGESTVVERAVSSAVSSGVGEVWVITGAVDLTPVLPSGVLRLQNDRWAHGQATSLQRAVGEACSRGVGALVVGLGDQPFVNPSAWQRVATSRSPLAVATYDGRRGHPVRLASTVWDLLPTDGDTGARPVMAGRPDLVEEIPCRGDPVDIDTREDLARWS